MFGLLRRQFQDYTEIRGLDHMTSNAAAKASGLLEGAPEVIAAIIHNLLYQKPHKKLKFNICVALLRRQFKDYIEIYGFLSQDV